MHNRLQRNFWQVPLQADVVAELAKSSGDRSYSDPLPGIGDIPLGALISRTIGVPRSESPLTSGLYKAGRLFQKATIEFTGRCSEIRNDAYDRWRDALAEAAGTTRERAWEENDSNLKGWCWIAPGMEPRVKTAIRNLLKIDR